MNRQLISWLLGWIAILIGASMLMSLPWAFPEFGEVEYFDARGFSAMLGTMALCGTAGAGLLYFGRPGRSARLMRKEAIAVVAMSWLMAALLGAFPFWLSGAAMGRDDAGRPIRIGFFQGMFESASGFSGTGATIITDLEDPELMPRPILFWRSETHFLGGLGIIVLFVAILGLGSAGKALMRTEITGPQQESPHARTQRAAMIFASIFIGMNVVLTLLLFLQGMSPFDALCHAFGTIATGGFSTYNKSVEAFGSVGIEMTIVVFMILACTNFSLLYFLLVWKPGMLLGDVEFRVYLGILVAATALVTGVGMWQSDFHSFGEAVRYSLFQVVSIQTNTGFGTRDFDRWTSTSRAALLVLMFIGGCAGSTSCSVKVIRYVLLIKILWLELEQVFHPTVVRPVRLGDKPLTDPELRDNVLIFFCVWTVLFVGGWFLLVAVEPEATWREMGTVREKLTDTASAVAATLNGVGPGLGLVGESQNYARFHAPSLFILTWLMLLGRLEVFVLAVLFVPRFWRSR